MKMVEVKSSKEKLPFTLVTTYINQGWQMVEQVKADIEGIKSEFSNSKVFTECLEDFSDACLILVGRLQKLLTENNYIEMPDLEAAKDDKKNINEDLTITVKDDGGVTITKDEIVEPIVDTKLPEAEVKTAVVEPAEVEEPIVDEQPTENGLLADDVSFDEDPDEDEEEKDDFDWDIEDDFPTPDFTQPKLTDDDLYKDLYDQHKE